ncbi:LOB domain-containing protein [Forsythia ovata]|uniref:LOB domain-containing protein n=1 Tax=Forsythia ovata TaxID=205694 RepID=A0ABD1UWW9_9LAMI
MKSMIYQANVRAIHPVGGCCHVIRELEGYINFYKEELDFVRRQIATLQDEIQKLGFCQKLGFDDQQVQGVEDGVVTTWEDQPSLAQKMEMEHLKPHLAAFKERQLQNHFNLKNHIWYG